MTRFASVAIAALIILVPVADALAQSKPANKPDVSGTRIPGTRIDPSSIDTKRIDPARAETARTGAPVRDCSEFGAGFKRAEGTGTCVKVGGYVRTQGSTH